MAVGPLLGVIAGAGLDKINGAQPEPGKSDDPNAKEPKPFTYLELGSRKYPVYTEGDAQKLGNGSGRIFIATESGLAQASRVSTSNTPKGSPVAYAHIMGADYTIKGGKTKPTGGHTLLNGDVRIVPGTESVPDATGVYTATIQVPDPQNPGQWLTKTSNGSENTMFPKGWDEARIKVEVDAAWNSPSKTVVGNRWRSVTPSGVKVEGYISPRVTVYPVPIVPRRR
jgi:hypothetical protein